MSMLIIFIHIHSVHCHYINFFLLVQLTTRIMPSLNREDGIIKPGWCQNLKTDDQKLPEK